MQLTGKQQRLTIVLLGLILCSIATAMILAALKDSVVYFYSPTNLLEKQTIPERRVRVGGLVKKNEQIYTKTGVVNLFILTDKKNDITVRFTGILPDLFREGQGVVAEGKIGPNGVFFADEVLAKHDENYMPPEVAETLRRSSKSKTGEPR